MTAIWFSASSLAVPPVDSSSTPKRSSSRQNSRTPVLSETLTSARVTFLFMQTSRKGKENGWKLAYAVIFQFFA